MGPFIIFAVIVLIAILLVVSNIYVVQQSRAYVIERMGAFERVDGVGLHFKAPFIDRVARRVSLKEQVLDYPPQPVITKDNVTMQIDTVVYFSITDPKLYTYGVEQPMMAMETLTATTLRNIIGDLEIHDRIDLHGNVILGNNRLGWIVQHLLFHAHPTGDPIDKGNFEVNAHAPYAMERTQTFNDISLGLLNHDDVGNHNNQQHDDNNGSNYKWHKFSS